LVFNPFENQHATGNEHNIDSDMLGSLNPDHNYYTSTKHETTVENNYYLTTDFIELIKQEHVLENQFSILSLNIRSIKNKFDNFLNYLATLKYSFTVTALTETWINDKTCDADEFNIPCRLCKI
jgi:hypothetical protein